MNTITMNSDIVRLRDMLAKSTSALNQAIEITDKVESCWDENAFGSIAYATGDLTGSITSLRIDAEYHNDYALPQIRSAVSCIEKTPLKRVSQHNPYDTLYPWQLLVNRLEAVVHLYATELDFASKGKLNNAELAIQTLV